MKIKIPENISEINLLQYQRYHELQQREDLNPHDFNVRKIQIFTGLNPTQVKMIDSKDYAEILSLIDIALDKEHGFNPFFTMGDIEFGFIPNLDKITAGEYIDITKYQTDIQEYHKLMAVLFRPIKKKDVFNNYELIPYKGTEQYSEIMKLMPLSAVTGSLVFFSSLVNELMSYTQKYFKVEQPKENKQMNTLTNGDGMQPLTS